MTFQIHEAQEVCSEKIRPCNCINSLLLCSVWKIWGNTPQHTTFETFIREVASNFSKMLQFQQNQMMLLEEPTEM